MRSTALVGEEDSLTKPQTYVSVNMHVSQMFWQ